MCNKLRNYNRRFGLCFTASHKIHFSRLVPITAGPIPPAHSASEIPKSEAKSRNVSSPVTQLMQRNTKEPWMHIKLKEVNQVHTQHKQRGLPQNFMFLSVQRRTWQRECSFLVLSTFGFPFPRAEDSPIKEFCKNIKTDLMDEQERNWIGI